MILLYSTVSYSNVRKFEIFEILKKAIYAVCKVFEWNLMDLKMNVKVIVKICDCFCDHF